MDGRFLAIVSQISSQLGQIVLAFEKHNTLSEKNLHISTQVLELSGGGGEVDKKESGVSQNTLDACLKEIIENKVATEKLRTEMLDLNTVTAKYVQDMIIHHGVTTDQRLNDLSERIKCQEEKKENHECVIKYHKEVCCLDDKRYVCGCPVVKSTQESSSVSSQEETKM